MSKPTAIGMVGLLATAALSLVAAVGETRSTVSPSGDDLGVIGPQWPIRETDLLDAMLSKVRQKQRSGETAQLAARMKQQAQNYAQSPPSLRLARAVRHRSSHFDPSIVVPDDIRDAQGRVLYAKGTTVNPLQHYPLSKTLLLIDASDADQLAWLKRRLTRETTTTSKVILTGGSPTELAKTLQRPVFFDQNGTLIQRFGIRAVPATVQIDPASANSRLLVQEFDPKEDTP